MRPAVPHGPGPAGTRSQDKTPPDSEAAVHNGWIFSRAEKKAADDPGKGLKKPLSETGALDDEAGA